MIGLVEGIDAGLPVRAPGAAHVMNHVHALDLIVLDVPGWQAEILLEGWRLAVHVDEDDAAVAAAAHLGEPRPVSDQPPIEGLLVGDALERAAAAELPAVKRAGETRHAAALVQANPIAPVRTDVVERPDAAVGLAHDD